MAESKDTPINVSAKNPVCNLCCAAKEEIHKAGSAQESLQKVKLLCGVCITKNDAKLRVFCGSCVSCVKKMCDFMYS